MLICSAHQQARIMGEIIRVYGEESIAPEVSVIIPSLDGYRKGNLPCLLEDIKRQTLKNLEIYTVIGIKPNGKARNEGVKKARGNILVFIDDDVRIKDNNVIEKIIQPIKEIPNIGLSGASCVLSRDENWIGKEYAKQRGLVSAIFNQLVDSDKAQHSCCAILTQIYKDMGGEKEDLITGTDNDLRFRLHKNGYRVVVAANTYIYHIMPRTLKEIGRAALNSGLGASYALRTYPEIFGRPRLKPTSYIIKTDAGALLYKFITGAIKLFWHILTLKLVGLIYEYYFLSGYTSGWFKFKKPRK